MATQPTTAELRQALARARQELTDLWAVKPPAADADDDERRLLIVALGIVNHLRAGGRGELPKAGPGDA